MLNCFLIFLFLSVVFCGCGFFPSDSQITERDKITFSSVSLKEKEAEGDVQNEEEQQGIIVSNTKKKVDILFIVDTSYAMVKYLQSADQTFKNFISYLSPISWKIAFTNADYDFQSDSYYGRDLFNGKAMRLELNGNILPYRFLYPYVVNNRQIFLDTLKRYESGDIQHISSDQYINPCDLPPYCQSNIRSPIGSLINSLSTNANFLREEAIFVAVIFTNGDDVHVQESSAAESFIRRFHERYGKEKKVLIYSISIFPGDDTCFNSNNDQKYDFAQVSYSENIHQFVRVTGGRALSICESDYSPLAAVIIRSL